MNQEEAKKKRKEIIDNLFRSDLYHVEVIDVYGYTKEQLEEQHRFYIRKEIRGITFIKSCRKKLTMMYII